jgi:phosphoribosylpyrophosphate synthetase
MIILPTNQAVHIGERLRKKYAAFNYMVLGTNADGRNEFPDREQYANVRDIERVHGEDVVVLHCGAPRPNSTNIMLKQVLCSLHDPQYSEGKVVGEDGRKVKKYGPLMIETGGGKVQVKPKSVQIFYLYPEYQMQDWPDKKGSINAIKNDLDIWMKMYGVKRFFTIDAHFAGEEWVKDYPLVNVSVMDLLVNKAREVGYKDLVLVGPDESAERRAIDLGIPMKVVEKHRINSYKSDMNVPEDIEKFIEGKDALEIDDVIETGNTLKKAGKLFMKCHPKRLGAAATHLRMTEGYKFLEEKEDYDEARKIFDEIIISNTIDTPYSIFIGVDVTDRVAQTLFKYM